MALTIAQYNAHIHVILVGAFPVLDPGERLPEPVREVLIPIIRRLVRYARLGADQKEAAQRLGAEIIERMTGHPITAEERHWLIHHLAEEAEPGSSGELA